MRYIKKIDDNLASFEKSLAVILYAALILSITFNIFTRNIFNFTFQKILEVTPAFVLWLALVGATLALRNQRHIKIELLLRFCTVRIRFLANIASCIFGTTVMGILFWVSLAFIKNEMTIFGLRGWVTFIFPLFFAISFFRYVARIIYLIADANPDKPVRLARSSGGRIRFNYKDHKGKEDIDIKPFSL